MHQVSSSNPWGTSRSFFAVNPAPFQYAICHGLVYQYSDALIWAGAGRDLAPVYGGGGTSNWDKYYADNSPLGLPGSDHFVNPIHLSCSENGSMFLLTDRSTYNVYERVGAKLL